MKLFSMKKDFTIPAGGISEIATVVLGGVPQSVLIQAEKRDNPVLLIVHGGPSMPFPGVGNRSRDYAVATTTKELVKHFVLVFYDQRGTGKSYSPDIPKSSINMEQFISDAEELVDYLRERFHQDKIALAGYSWGSVIGLALASRIPGKLHVYFGLSQIVNWAENDRLNREWAMGEARRRNDRKALRELEELGEPPYVESFKQWGVLRKYLNKYKAMIYTDKDVKHPGMIGGVGILFKSPDYSLKDIFHTFYSGFMLSYTQQMIEDFARIDFVKSAPRLDIPVYFIHGKKDVHVFGEPVRHYVEQLDASRGKRMIWVDKSSHMFHPDDAREIEKIMIEEIHRVIGGKTA